jgi:mannose-6-phosphate isomerase class I
MDQPHGDTLAACEYFKTDRKTLKAGESLSNPNAEKFSIISVVDGELKSADGRHFAKGQFILLPKASSPLTAGPDSTVLQITLPE